MSEALFTANVTTNKVSKFQQAFERVAWTAMTMICFYAASQIKEMATSVQELNKNFAVLVERVSNQQNQLGALDSRVSYLESSDARARRKLRGE